MSDKLRLPIEKAQKQHMRTSKTGKMFSAGKGTEKIVNKQDLGTKKANQILGMYLASVAIKAAPESLDKYVDNVLKAPSSSKRFTNDLIRQVRDNNKELDKLIETHLDKIDLKYDIHLMDIAEAESEPVISNLISLKRKQLQTEFDYNIASVKPEDVIRAYSGKPDSCMCGCSGTYYNNEGHKKDYEGQGKDRPGMVSKILDKMKNEEGSPEKILTGSDGEKIFTKIFRTGFDSWRQYTIYLKPEESK